MRTSVSIYQNKTYSCVVAPEFYVGIEGDKGGFANVFETKLALMLLSVHYGFICETYFQEETQFCVMAVVCIECSP